jgi:hypothetical protein
MTRRLAALALGITLVAAASAQPPAGGGNDAVRYRDKKKDGQESVARGEVQESVRGVKVTAGGKTLIDLAPNEVISVDYARLPGLDPAALRLTEARDPAKARDDYQAALKGSLADAKARRFAEFREAILSARLADGKTVPAEFQAEAAAAVEKLLAFVRAHPDGWEVWPAARTAARLQGELGKYSDAAGTFALLAKTRDLPAELAQQARLDEVEMLMRGGNALAAGPAATALAGSPGFPKTGPAADRLKAFQAVIKAGGDPADAAKAVREVIDRTTDAGVRAAAHAALGELFLARNRPREAMWEYLWVETVYAQDRDEVAHAVARLADVFDKLGDKERAAAYREKLPRVKLGT